MPYHRLGGDRPRVARTSVCVEHWDHGGVDAKGHGVCVVMCVLVGPHGGVDAKGRSEWGDVGVTMGVLVWHWGYWWDHGGV